MRIAAVRVAVVKKGSSPNSSRKLYLAVGSSENEIHILGSSSFYIRKNGRKRVKNGGDIILWKGKNLKRVVYLIFRPFKVASSRLQIDATLKIKGQFLHALGST